MRITSTLGVLAVAAVIAAPMARAEDFRWSGAVAPGKVLEIKGETEQKIRQTQNLVRSVAILVPPLPPLVLALLVFGTRIRRENLGANPNRLA